MRVFIFFTIDDAKLKKMGAFNFAVIIYIINKSKKVKEYQACEALVRLKGGAFDL